MVDMFIAVIFDFDFTLGDSSDGIIECTNYVLKTMGYPERTSEAIKKTIGLSLSEMFFRLGSADSTDKADEFAMLYREKADVVITANTTLYDGVLDVLRKLRSLGIRCGIVTTKFHYRIDQILEKFSAADLIDVIIGGDDVLHEKPSPEGLFKAIETLGIDKREVLYVGDSLVDAKTAQLSGVDFAAVLTGTTTDFSEYDNVFIGNNLRKVLDFVIKI